jgi:transcriptional regulator with XRE-family HTH domain
MANLTLGQQLRRIRDLTDKSMRAVAREAGISVAYLSKIEHDEANPTIDVLRKVAQALGVGIDEFTGSAHNEVEPPITLPDSLAQFIAEKSSEHPELNDPDWQKMLLGIRLRGKYPEKQDDWLVLFIQAKRALID